MKRQLAPDLGKAAFLGNRNLGVRSLLPENLAYFCLKILRTVLNKGLKYSKIIRKLERGLKYELYNFLAGSLGFVYCY